MKTTGYEKHPPDAVPAPETAEAACGEALPARPGPKPALYLPEEWEGGPPDGMRPL